MPGCEVRILVREPPARGRAGDGSSRAPPGEVRGAAPAAGHWPRRSGRNRATWQGSGLGESCVLLTASNNSGFHFARN